MTWKESDRATIAVSISRSSQNLCLACSSLGFTVISSRLNQILKQAFSPPCLKASSSIVGTTEFVHLANFNVMRRKWIFETLILCGCENREAQLSYTDCFSSVTLRKHYTTHSLYILPTYLLPQHWGSAICILMQKNQALKMRYIPDMNIKDR